MKTPFADLSTRGQLAALRPYALGFIDRFGLRPSRIELALHSFNTTYRVTDHDGTRYALRLNVNSIRSKEELQAEVAWVDALAGTEGLTVAKARQAATGEHVLFSPWDGTDRDLAAVCYSWLPGRVSGKGTGPETARLVGEATKALHAHALTFALPAGASLRDKADVLFGKPLLLQDRKEISDLGVFREVQARCEDAYSVLARQPRRATHFDLHFGNMKFSRGKIYVFDFDDSVMAWPAIDSSVTQYYWRAKPNHSKLDEAYWRTGVTCPADQGLTWDQHEALVAGRGLFLCNELVQMMSAEIVALTPKYLRTTELRFKDYLKTGKLDCSIRAD